MIVVAVGGNSQWGVILKTLIVEPQSTPLQAGAYTRPMMGIPHSGGFLDPGI
jgi:hypothetical protein